MISFACPCGQALRAKDEMGGKRLRCPACGQIKDVPKVRALQAAGGPLPSAGEPKLGGAGTGHAPEQVEPRKLRVTDHGLPQAGAAGNSAERLCPKCFLPVAAQAVTCPTCLTDLRTGRSIAPQGSQDVAARRVLAVVGIPALVLALVGAGLYAWKVHKDHRAWLARHRISCSLGRLMWTRVGRNYVVLAFERNAAKQIPPKSDRRPQWCGYSAHLPDGTWCTPMGRKWNVEPMSADDFLTSKLGYDEDLLVDLTKGPGLWGYGAATWVAIEFSSHVPDPRKIVLEGDDLGPVTLDLPADVTWP